MTELTVLNIETTEQELFISEPEKHFFHTNHYLCNKWTEKNKHKDPSTTSFSRFKRLLEIVPGSDVTQESALKLISDPKVFSYENEIYPGWYGKSFASVVYNITSEKSSMVIYPYNRDSSSKIEINLLV
jgi:hypothetical protein